MGSASVVATVMATAGGRRAPRWLLTLVRASGGPAPTELVDEPAPDSPCADGGFGADAGFEGVAPGSGKAAALPPRGLSEPDAGCAPAGERPLADCCAPLVVTADAESGVPLNAGRAAS